MNDEKWAVYILQCSDDSLYTGITTDLVRRLRQHASGTGSKYVRSRLPFSQVWLTLLMTKSQALKLEYKIKQLHKDKKVEALNKYYQKQIRDRGK